MIFINNIIETNFIISVTLQKIYHTSQSDLNFIRILLISLLLIFNFSFSIIFVKNSFILKQNVNTLI